MSINVDDTPSKKMKLLERENDGLATQLTEREREIDYLKAQLELDAEDRLAKSILSVKQHRYSSNPFLYCVKKLRRPLWHP